MMKNPVKLFCSVLLAVFAAGCSGCCAAENNAQCNQEPAQCSEDCNCPVLLVMGEEQDQIGDCTVCTVWCDAYSPCMNAVAACPAQAKKSLKDAPFCKNCKEKIVQCAKQRKACGVCGKDKTACTACKAKLDNEKVCKLMTKDSMKANMNCKSCAAKAKNDAMKNAMTPDQKKEAANADNADNSGDDAVLVVEEGELTITPVPAPAPAAAPASPAGK